MENPIEKNKEMILQWEKEYPGYHLWGNQRWAWEFLKRNQEFRKECDELNKMDQSRRIVFERIIAEKYGLKKFLSYDNKVKPGNIFLIGTIKCWPFDAEEDNNIELSIQPGQFVIVFNVHKTLDGEFEFDAQINKAKKELKQYREELLLAKNKEESDLSVERKNDRKKKTWTKNYIRHLKINDERLKEKKTTWANIARQIFPDGIYDKDGGKLEDFEIVSKYHKMMKASLEKPKEYRSILLSDKESSFSGKIEKHMKMKKFFKN